MLFLFLGDVLYEIWDLNESDSEGFPTYILICGFLLLRNFSLAISVSPHVCFILFCFTFSSYVSKIMHLWARNLSSKPNN